MWMNTPCEALRRPRMLKLRYDGYSRCVEVHAVGYSRPRHAVMRAWQVRGGSVSRERVGWKLMRLDEASAATVTDETSDAPRSEYKRGDPAIERIVCQL